MNREQALALAKTRLEGKMAELARLGYVEVIGTTPTGKPQLRLTDAGLAAASQVRARSKKPIAD